MSDAALLSDADVGLGAPAAPATSQSVLSDEDVGLGGAVKGAASAEPSVGADVAKSAGQGLIGGVEGLLGLPGDLVQAGNWVNKKVSYPLDYGTSWLAGVAKQKMGLLGPGETPHTYATKQVEQWNALQDKIMSGAAPTSADFKARGESLGIPNYQSRTVPGQYAKTIVESVPGALAMPGGAVGNAIKYGVIPGVASETAGQLTQGTAAEPYARGAAALVGGVGSDLAVAGGSAVKSAAKNWWEPATEAGPDAIAARQLRQAATDPEMAQAILQEHADAAKPGQALGENIPDSRPATGPLTGDAGLTSLSRDVATQRPDLYHNNEHGTGVDQQNAARSQALQNIQPTGAPEEVGNLVRQQLADLNAAQDAKVTQATDAAGQTSNDALTSTESAANTIAQAHGAATDTARQTAQDLASGIGTGAPAAEQGAAARGILQAARKVDTVNEGKLHEAIDPDGTLNVVAAPIADAAKAIVKAMPKLADPLAGKEAAIFDAASNVSDVEPFQEIAALQSRVSTALSEVLGKDPQAYRRLTQLRGAIENTIQNAVENQAAHEAKAVQAGALAPEQTMEARVQKWADDFKAQKAAEAAGQTSTSAKTATPKPSPYTFVKETGFNDGTTTYHIFNGEQTPENHVASASIRFDNPDAKGRPTSAHVVSVDAAGAADAAYADEDLSKFNNTVGPRAGLALRREILADHPTVKTFTGNRVGGARFDGRYADTSEGKPVSAKMSGPKPEPASDGALKPNFDEASVARRDAANAATKARVWTHDKGPVGVANRKEGNSENFRLPDSAVPRVLFRPGPRGAQTVQSVLNAAGPRGMNQVAKIAAESLRSEAVGPDGVVDPKKFASWSKKYGEALSALPPELRQRFSSAAAATETLQALEKQGKQIVAPLQGAVESLGREVMQDGALDPKKFARWQAKHADEIAQLPQDVQDKLATAGKASEAVGEAATARKQAIDGYQKSVAGKFLGLEHPADVTRTIGGMLDSKNAVAQITALSKRIAASPDNADAVQGLRKAVADVIVQRATGTTEAGTSGVKKLNASTFQKLIRDKRAAIKAAGYSDQEIGHMQAIADDMERSQRTMSGTALPNSPGTAQDVAKFMAKAQKEREMSHKASLLSHIFGGALGGWELGGVKGAFLGAAAGAGEAFAQRFIQARRAAGLAKASDLLTRAVYDPEFALALLKKAPAISGRGSEYALQRLLARNSMFTATTLGRQNGETDN